MEKYQFTDNYSNDEKIQIEMHNFRVRFLNCFISTHHSSTSKRFQIVTMQLVKITYGK